MADHKQALIIANGALHATQQARHLAQSADLLIAADGGARHCRDLGLAPDTIIGDFDSLDGELLAGFAAAGARLVRYPAEKDFTDLELALRYAAEEGFGHVIVLGALGERWDQTLANLLLPAAPGMEGLTIRLIDGLQEVQLLRGGGQVTLRGHPGDTVSLVPVSGEAGGVHTTGLAYPLAGETLYLGATRGISNVLQGETATVSLAAGLLLCILIHQSTGIPGSTG